MLQKRMKIILSMLAVIAVVGCIYFGIRLLEQHEDALAEDAGEDDYSVLENTDHVLELNGKAYQIEGDVKTYLFIGTDESGNEEAAGEEYQGSMADFLMLAVIDETKQHYGFLQLNRDTITDVTLLLHDGTGYASADIQLCTAHWYGWDKKSSCENTVDAVSRMLGGLPIDGYYSLQMKSIPELNHAVGGVTVIIEDDFSALDSEMKAGRTLTLNDEQAYLYVRSRQVLKDDTNIARMKRQRTFMDGLMIQAKEKSRDNQQFIVKLYDEMSDYAVTNIGSRQISKLSKNIGGYQELGLYTLDGKSGIGTRLGDGIEHAEFYLDDTSVEEVMRKLYSLSYVGEAAPEEDVEGEEYIEDDENDGEEEE